MSELKNQEQIVKGIVELTDNEKKILEFAEKSFDNIPEGKFVKFKADEHRDFYFVVEKLQVIYTSFNQSTNEYKESPTEFDGSKITYKFIVVDPTKNEDELEWSCTNYACARKIIGYLKQGIKFLSIKRIGEAKKTIYDVEIAR